MNLEALFLGISQAMSAKKRGSDRRGGFSYLPFFKWQYTQ